MERTALRLATVAALLNGGNGPPWPTLANEFVYDSMQDHINDVVPHRRRPVIVVRTDDDRIGFRTNQPTGRECLLIVEIGVVTSVTDNLGRLLTDWPKTDAALEALLDSMEWQVWNGLRGYAPWAQWFQHYYGPIAGYTSTPRFTAPDRGNVRLAVRSLEFILPLPMECLVQPLHQYDPLVPAALPPRLKEVIDFLLATASGDFRTAVTEMLAVIMRRAPITRARYPALHRVWVELPDLELEADWHIEQAMPLTSAALTGAPPLLSTPNLNP